VSGTVLGTEQNEVLDLIELTFYKEGQARHRERNIITQK
jgi:hypothetical protein